MHRKKLLADLQAYALSPFIMQEERSTLERFLDFVQQEPACFERTTVGHVTASTWIVSHNKQHALFTHHKKFKLWIQLGGHADGDSDTKRVALKEAIEESGIQQFTFLTTTIFDIDIHPIPSHCAFHYDVRYVLQAPSDAKISISDESLDLAWIAHQDIAHYSKERSVIRLKEKFLQHFL